MVQSMTQWYQTLLGSNRSTVKIWDIFHGCEKSHHYNDKSIYDEFGSQGKIPRVSIRPVESNSSEKYCIFRQLTCTFSQGNYWYYFPQLKIHYQSTNCLRILFNAVVNIFMVNSFPVYMIYDGIQNTTEKSDVV